MQAGGDRFEPDILHQEHVSLPLTSMGYQVPYDEVSSQSQQKGRCKYAGKCMPLMRSVEQPLSRGYVLKRDHIHNNMSMQVC